MSISRKTYARKDALIMILQGYSIDSAINGPELAAKVGISYRALQDLAAILTCEGLPIGSDCDHGYYWARTPEEMEPKIHQLQSRIVGNAKHLKGAKRAQRLLERKLGIERPKTQLKLILLKRQMEIVL